MKKRRKVLWGIVFLLVAALLIAGDFYDIPVSDILITLAMLLFLAEVIARRYFALILFPVAVTVILYSDRLGIPKLSPWSVLAAALFGSIGLSALFPHRGRHWRKTSFCGRHVGAAGGKDGHAGEHWRGSEEIVQDGSGGEVCLENSFGDTAKYLNGELSGQVCLENSFGNMSVYFDNAVLREHTARVYAKSSFGNIVLYVPSAWNVVIQGDAVFCGNVTERGRCNPAGENTLEVSAQVSFGEIEIRYI